MVWRKPILGRSLQRNHVFVGHSSIRKSMFEFLLVRSHCAVSPRYSSQNFNLPCLYLLAHRTTQHPPPSPFSNVSRAARVAASNTSSTPSPVKDEHSRYFLAPISCAISVASRVLTKCCDLFRISSMATGSSRRSFFNPTRIMGTLGHRSLASSTH